MLPCRPNFPQCKSIYFFLYTQAQTEVELLPFLSNTLHVSNVKWGHTCLELILDLDSNRKGLYLSRISIYCSNLIKWENTHKTLSAKNVTLPWYLVVVPSGWWNVIICNNRKQTGLWVSGYCLFSSSQAQQHWEPDIRRAQVPLQHSSIVPYQSLKYRWIRGTFKLLEKCSLKSHDVYHNRL